MGVEDCSTFRMAVICRNNEVRSRGVQTILQSRLDGFDPELAVFSYGSSAQDGTQMPYGLYGVLRQRGYRPDDSLSSRKLTDKLLLSEKPDLILCFSERQRNWLEDMMRRHSMAGRVELIHKYASAGRRIKEMKDPAKFGEFPDYYKYIPYFIARRCGLLDYRDEGRVKRFYTGLVDQMEEMADGVIARMLDEGLIRRRGA